MKYSYEIYTVKKAIEEIVTDTAKLEDFHFVDFDDYEISPIEDLTFGVLKNDFDGCLIKRVRVDKK